MPGTGNAVDGDMLAGDWRCGFQKRGFEKRQTRRVVCTLEGQLVKRDCALPGAEYLGI